MSLLLCMKKKKKEAGNLASFILLHRVVELRWGIASDIIL